MGEKKKKQNNGFILWNLPALFWSVMATESIVYIVFTFQVLNTCVYIPGPNTATTTSLKCSISDRREWRLRFCPSVCAACLVRLAISFTSLASGWCHSSRGHWILCSPNLEFQLGGQFLLSEFFLNNTRQRQPIVQRNKFLCV